MKKTILTILVCGVLILGLTGCNNANKTDTEDNNDIHTFKATILECNQKNMIVKPDETEDEYNEFVSNAKNSSLYNIDANATYGDQLITLSTCSYHVKDGRFAVVGRKISSDIGDTQKRPEN